MKIERYEAIKIYRQIDRSTDRQTERQINRQIDIKKGFTEDKLVNPLYASIHLTARQHIH